MQVSDMRAHERRETTKERHAAQHAVSSPPSETGLCTTTGEWNGLPKRLANLTTATSRRRGDM